VYFDGSYYIYIKILSSYLLEPNSKFMIFTSLLSLGGLPPFLGYLPKWIVIQAIITNNSAPLATIVVVTSLITLYEYYLKISYSRFIILNTEPKWNLKFHKNKSTKSTWALIHQH